MPIPCCLPCAFPCLTNPLVFVPTPRSSKCQGTYLRGAPRPGEHLAVTTHVVCRVGPTPSLLDGLPCRPWPPEGAKAHGATHPSSEWGHVLSRGGYLLSRLQLYRSTPLHLPRFSMNVFVTYLSQIPQQVLQGFGNASALGKASVSSVCAGRRRAAQVNCASTRPVYIQVSSNRIKLRDPINKTHI